MTVGKKDTVAGLIFHLQHGPVRGCLPEPSPLILEGSPFFYLPAVCGVRTDLVRPAGGEKITQFGLDNRRVRGYQMKTLITHGPLAGPVVQQIKDSDRAGIVLFGGKGNGIVDIDSRFTVAENFYCLYG